MKIKIPNKIKIFNQTIRVEFNDKMCLDNEALGLSELDLNIMYLAAKKGKKKIPRAKIEKVFFHELSHFILWTMRQEKLTFNETFVDNLATVLYDIMSNNDFKEEKEK